jgi:ribosomal protein S8
MPDLLSGTGRTREDPRRNQGELVTMNLTDPIGDMLTRIRNANRALKPELDVPYSRLKAELAKVLKSEGFIADFHAEKQEDRQVLKIQLKIVGKERAITGLRRASKRPANRARCFRTPNATRTATSGTGGSWMRRYTVM